MQKALDKKGICYDKGRIQIKTILSEGNGIKKDVRIKPIYTEVTSLEQYFKFLKEIHCKDEEFLKGEKGHPGNLFLYRGQSDVNYLFTPSILRNTIGKENEHLLFQEFHKRFYEKFDSCRTVFDKETIMQHYGVGSRCLDLMENPLVALWAACDNIEKNSYGEVSIWSISKKSTELKYSDSSTVSVIANTAAQEPCFSLGQLEIDYRKEHPTSLSDYIFLRDVLRRSVIVRPKYNNQRIYNQQGCFAIVNSNELVDDGEFEQKFHISVKKFSEYILNASEINKDMDFSYRNPNVYWLRQNKHTLPGVNFSELTSWDLRFYKQSVDESTFTDVYDLYKYMYDNNHSTTNDKCPVYVIIPPKAKIEIANELKYMNITDAYIYPEMENVSKELKSMYGL